mmetsp:Transcript_4900/g.6655  ORF Transcript_4900/g.6655 Transcript_4900/m.6655 type:complete len:188 (+) Transcript_4900:36-599(+)
MASRNAKKRPEGTDGSDFSYRHRVDARYQEAAAIKARIKQNIHYQSCCFLPYVCWALAVLHCAPPPLSVDSLLPVCTAVLAGPCLVLSTRLGKNTAARLPYTLSLTYAVCALAIVQFMFYLKSVFESKAHSTVVASAFLEFVGTQDESAAWRVRTCLHWVQRILAGGGVVMPFQLAHYLRQLSTKMS